MCVCGCLCVCVRAQGLRGQAYFTFFNSANDVSRLDLMRVRRLRNQSLRLGQKVLNTYIVGRSKPGAVAAAGLLGLMRRLRRLAVLLVLVLGVLVLLHLLRGRRGVAQRLLVPGSGPRDGPDSGSSSGGVPGGSTAVRPAGFLGLGLGVPGAGGLLLLFLGLARLAGARAGPA